MMTEFEMKKIVQDLKDPNKFEIGIQRLDKFARQNPNYDIYKTLCKESEAFAKNII